MNMLKRIGSIHKGSTHRKGRKKHVLFKASNEKTKNDPGKVSQIPLKKKTAKKRFFPEKKKGQRTNGQHMPKAGSSEATASRGRLAELATTIGKSVVFSDFI